MVQIILTMATAPRQTAEVITAFRSLRLEIKSLKGLICSQLYLNADQPSSICYIEEWRTPEDVSEAAAAMHFRRLFELMERSPEAPAVRVISVDTTRGFDYLSELIGAVPPETNPPKRPVKKRQTMAEPGAAQE